MHDNFTPYDACKTTTTKKILYGCANMKWRAGNLVIARPRRRMTILGRKEETTEYPTVMIFYWAFPDTVQEQQGESLHERRQNELK